MESSQQLCFILSLAAALGLVIFGFMQIFRKDHPAENDVQGVQRQLRGFACLILAQVILVAGVAMCSSLDLDAVRHVIRSARS